MYYLCSDTTKEPLSESLTASLDMFEETVRHENCAMYLEDEDGTALVTYNGLQTEPYDQIRYIGPEDDPEERDRAYGIYWD